MALPRMSGRRRYTLLLLVLASITLLTLDVRGFGPLATVQSGVRNILSPIRSGLSAIVDPIGDAWNGIADYDDLKSENAELRERIDAIEGTAIAEASARAELNAMSEQLGIDFLDQLPREVARVVGGELGNFSEFTVEIDRGGRDGLAVGMPVVTSAGLVGKLIRVDRDRSIVQLISDSEFAVGVRLVGANKIGLGRGNDDALIIDQGIAADVDVAVGEAIVTGGRASLFPAGIPVGVVFEVRAEAGNETQTLVATLAADTKNLDFVTVVLYDPERGGEESIPLPTLPTETTVAGDDATSDVDSGAATPATPATPAPTTTAGGGG